MYIPTSGDIKPHIITTQIPFRYAKKPFLIVIRIGAPEGNIPRAISVLTLGNTVILYCKTMLIRSL